MLKCIICKNNIYKNKTYNHLEWNKKMIECNFCNHVFLDDSLNNKQESKFFNTNTVRANRYLNFIKNLSFDSILEIGTPDDFYFLKKIYEINNKTKLYSFDIFEKKNKPNFIEIISLNKTFNDDKDITNEFINKLKDKNFDLIYCTHVMEHIPNVEKFIQILNYCNNFIFEIPVYNNEYFKNLKENKIKTTSYHYQFFNKKNIVKFLNDNNIKCKIIFSKDEKTPFNKGNVIFTNLDCYFSNNFELLN